MKKIFLFWFAILLIGTTSASWTQNLNNGLIGYWGMNEGTGNNLTEEVYGINNASTYGGVDWKVGINNNATGDYIAQGDVAKLYDSSAYNFNSNNSFSINLWINKTSTENDAGFVVKQDSEYRGWILREMGAGTMTFQLLDVWPSNYFRANFPNAIQSDGKWHHYSVTYSGTGDYGGVKLYKDGIEMNQSGSTSAGTLTNTSNNIPLQFGGWLYSGVYNYQMKGDLDEIGIWNRVLNSSEIQQLYNNGNGSFYTDNFTGNITGAIQWENESILNVNSSVWWSFMNGFNATHFLREYNRLTISESWLSSFVTSIINYNYINNLGFYPNSNPANYYNITTLPPQTGISFSYYNITNVDVTTTNSTDYNITILTLPFNFGKKVSIECNLLVDSSTTNTGIQFNSTVSGTSSRRQVIEYYTSATAQAICSGTNESLLCLASASAGTVTTPTKISVYTNQSSNGLFKLNLKSEVLGSAVNVRAGSWCRSIENSNF